jgi:chemotaxis protein MotA
MDIASVLGLAAGVVLLFGSILLANGASFGAFLDGPSLLMVVGGSLAAALISMPLRNVLNMGRVCRRVFFNRHEDFADLVDQLVSLAEIARRQGLLALENRVETITNPFLALGLQMAVDGTRAEVIEDVLRTEMEAVSARHRNGKLVLEQLSRFAPAFGMVGTLVGLVIMLCNMRNPEAVGPGMAVAMITTLYGVVIANLFCIPFAEKLSYLSRHELMAMEIIVRGILGIQSGDHPRIIEQRLTTFVPRESRGKFRQAA